MIRRCTINDVAISGVELPAIFDAENLEILASQMLELEQADCPVIHRFSPGIYIREVQVPAGVLAVGHHQRFEQLNVFLKGRITMFNEDGTTTELSAPMIFTGPPGQKCGLVHESMVWLNIYATEETDIEVLENRYLDKDASPSWNKYNDLRKNANRAADTEDYKNIIKEVGLTEKDVRTQTEHEGDQVPMPHGDYKMMVSDSPIEGKGVFATANIKNGEIIGPALINNKRTPIGRYANHAAQPNAEMKLFGKDVYIVATKDMVGCKGGFVGDEITTDYRKTLNLRGVKCLE